MSTLECFSYDIHEAIKPVKIIFKKIFTNFEK